MHGWVPAVLGLWFAGGVNTVTLTRRVSHSRRRALTILLADAIAPVGGVLAALFVVIAERLALALAFFVEHFPYIGASDVIPHRGERSWRVIAVHVAGIGSILLLTCLAAV